MLRNALLKVMTGKMGRRAFMRNAAGMGIGTVAAGQLARRAAARDWQDNEHTSKSVSLTDASGGQITCETLKSWGVEYVFGNTGAYEAAFVDAMVGYPDMHYVLGLHEGPVMAMADGYARAAGKVGFVNIHSITGTANALGLIVNAWADDSPVVVSVGFSSTGFDTLGVFTETQKVETIPELYTKLSIRAGEPDNLAETLRQSFRLATLLPSGPVFVGVPSDIWRDRLETVEIVPAARSDAEYRIMPDRAGIVRAAEMLAAARNPLLIAGAELPRWGGLSDLADLADRLGAVVSGDTASSRSSMGFPTDHPRYLGDLRRPIDSETPFDVVVLAGASRLSLARGGHPLVPTEATIIEFGLREDHMARGYPADLLLYAHPQAVLERLNAALAGLSLDEDRIAARRREAESLAARIREGRKRRLEQVMDSTPIAPERLAYELDRALAPDAQVVTEGVSSDRAIRSYLAFDQPGGGRTHLISSGGSLGWGLGAGIGAKLGRPDKQTAILLGDGSYQFGVQALWTAARFRLPLIVAIFNNRGYQANRWAIHGLGRDAAESGRYIGVTLDDPDIDHVAIARGYGLEGERVTDPAALPAALARAVEAERAGRAYVLDVIVDTFGPGADQAGAWHEGMAQI